MTRKILTPCFWYITVIGLSLWIIGFGVFCLYALSLRYHHAERTDAIVVLTGGNERISKALNLLNKNYAQYLLISGVNQMVKDEEIIGSLPPQLTESVELGRNAQDTRGNALEVADFVRGKPIRTILLITSFYHMPRSIFEVSKQNPNLDIIPFPVFPKTFGQSVEWIRTRYAWLLFVEYHKFIATVMQNFVERIFS